MKMKLLLLIMFIQRNMLWPIGKRTMDNGVAIEMLDEQKYDPNPPAK
jgi:hypothetical protein